jgi:hypothetical protein
MQHLSPHSRRSYVEMDRAKLRRFYDQILVALTERADATATSSNTAPPSRFPTPGP